MARDAHVERKVVILVATFDSYVPPMIELARKLAQTNNYRPLICFHHAFPNLERDLAKCRDNHLEVIISDDLISQVRSSTGRVRGLASRVRRLAGRLLARLPGAALVLHLRHGMSKIRWMRAVIREHGAQLLVFGGDIISHDMKFFIRAADRECVPTVLMPNWMASPLEAAESVYMHKDYQVQGWAGALMSRFWPQWITEHKGRRLIRLPILHVLALKVMGIAPPQPWVLHSGFADLIAVESQSARNYGVREGLEPAKLVVVGSTVHDVMAAERTGNGGQSQSRSALIALPPNMLDGASRPDCEFGNYEDLVRFWLDTATSHISGPIVVSLHPSTRREEIAHLVPDSVSVSTEPVQRLIPHCDVYVASISATIQWAISCGKPVINYDVYKYRYTDYQGVSGVVLVEDQQGFADECNRMFNDDAYFRSIKESQEKVAEEWGVLDGHAFERTLRLFDSLTGHQ